LVNPTYYVYTLGAWRVYALDSNISMAVGSAQYNFVQNDLVHRQYRFRTVSYGKSHETTYLRTFVVGKGARAARSRIALQRHFHFAPFPDAPGEFEGG
jgi:hypothetical protein